MKSNKLNLIKEVEEDRLSIYQKNKQLEEELLKLNQMKETIARFSLQNTTLTQENAKLNEEILNLRQKKKEYSSELEQMKEQNRLLLFNSQRDQDHLKQCEVQVKNYKDENERLNVNLKEKQGLFEEQMILKQEMLKKKNNEIAEYQEKNEDLKKKIEFFKRDTKENQGNAEMNKGFVGNKEEFSMKLKEQENLKRKLKDELIKISQFEEDME